MITGFKEMVKGRHDQQCELARLADYQLDPTATNEPLFFEQLAKTLYYPLCRIAPTGLVRRTLVSTLTKNLMKDKSL